MWISCGRREGLAELLCSDLRAGLQASDPPGCLWLCALTCSRSPRWQWGLRVGQACVPLPQKQPCGECCPREGHGPGQWEDAGDPKQPRG